MYNKFRLPAGRPKIATKSKELRTDADGTVFDSHSEMIRYKELQILQRGGHIRELYRQQSFPLVINNKKIGLYTCDFVYEEKSPAGDWVTVYEEYKGFFTDDSQFRIKVFEAVYGVKVRITGPAKKRGKSRKIA
jgi:hypothetical protein